MSSSKAKKSIAAVAAAKGVTAPPPHSTAPAVQIPGPIELFVSGDALAARRAAAAILADDKASEALRTQAREFEARCAADRPTLCLLAGAWAVVLSIVAALYLF